VTFWDNIAGWFEGVWLNLLLWFDDVKAEFILNFIDKNRWKLLVTGLGNTLVISLAACLIGIVIGVVIAVIRSTWDNQGHHMKRGLGRLLMSIANRISVIYVTIIRGTPVVVQLLLIYYVIMAWSRNGVMIAAVAFGINSGAYVSEIFRGGIMSIEKGQMEAGRSLGLNYLQTMWYIIAPQVLKNVLPTLANEFIVLLKETSISGYVAVMDLTFAGNRIRGVTFSPLMPLLAIALIYLVLVMFFTMLVNKLERRLRQSDIR